MGTTALSLIMVSTVARNGKEAHQGGRRVVSEPDLRT